MDWLESIWDFVSNNAATLIITGGAGVLFFVLGPLGVWFSGRKIRKERIRKAKDSLLDIFEGMLVNQEEITPKKLSLLISAVEREGGVSLDGVHSVDWLIEDVMLQFQKSKHLDAQQKQEYYSKLSGVHDAFNEESEAEPTRHAPRDESGLLDKLRESVKGNEKAEQLVKELQTQLDRRSKAFETILGPFPLYRKFFENNPKRFILISAFAFTIYLLFVLWFFLR